MRTALVTGASGFVGRHLTDHLTGQGWQVVPADRRHGVDVRRYEQVRSVVEHTQPDTIYHLAAQAYVPEAGTDPRRGVDVNVVGTLNLLEAVRHTGCRARVLLAGTSEEYGYETQTTETVAEDSPARPTTLYGVSKLAAGQVGLVYACTYGIPVVVTRAWNHTGPGQPAVYAVPGFARQVALVEAGTQVVVRHGNLDARRCYLDVRDVVRAYTAAVGCDPGVYNVACQRVVTMGEVLTLLTGMAAATVAVEPDPALYRPGWQHGSPTFPTPDTRLLRRVAGWTPQIPLEETLADILNHWRGQT